MGLAPSHVACPPTQTLGEGVVIFAPEQEAYGPRGPSVPGQSQFKITQAIQASDSFIAMPYRAPVESKNT